MKEQGKKGRKAYESWHSGKKLRIRLIHEFIMGASGTQSEMLIYVNKKLRELDLPIICLATLQTDLSFLNSGTFLNEKELTTFNPFPGEKYFNAKLDKKNGKYYYEEPNIPPLNRLTKEEEMTLPFLTSLLNPYDDIPAFKKFLDEAASIFDKDLKKVDTSKTFSIVSPKFNFSIDRVTMISNLLKLLKHIEDGEEVTFDYSNPSVIEYRKKTPGDKSTIILKPLYIRLYQNLYYLTGIRQDAVPPVQNFRIDLIRDNSIKPILLGKDTMKMKTFDVEKARKDSQLEGFLQRSLGIWIHPETSHTEVVIIRFHGWAAKHLQTFQLHHSQTYIPASDNTGYSDYEFTLCTYDDYLDRIIKEERKRAMLIQDGSLDPQNRPYVAWLSRYPEAGYIFGRFINFIEFIGKK